MFDSGCKDTKKKRNNKIETNKSTES